MLTTSGTGPFAKVAFQLKGPDAANISGTYSSGDNTSLTENQTLTFSIDGDLTVSGTDTQMSGANAAGNTDVDFTATVTLTEASSGTLNNSTQTATGGIATFYQPGLYCYRRWPVLHSHRQQPGRCRNRPYYQQRQRNQRRCRRYKNGLHRRSGRIGQRHRPNHSARRCCPRRQ